MTTMRLTAKRQATLPRALCDELGVHPGDTLSVERTTVRGQPAWIIRACHVDWSWFGSVPVPVDAVHDMESIRTSIGQAIGEERS